jgi:hypothetical protein
MDVLSLKNSTGKEMKAKILKTSVYVGSRKLMNFIKKKFAYFLVKGKEVIVT